MVSLGVPLLGSLLLLGGAAWLVKRAVSANTRRPFPPSMWWILPGLGVIYVVGVWWGVPWSGWAADELPPDLFLVAMQQHFSGGWHDKYPPVHYVLNAVLYLPFAVAAWLGALDLAAPAVQITLLLLSRGLSIVMALGAACAVFLLADDLYGSTGAAFAAVIAGVMLPFVYYAKLANVDVPSIFWFAWALYYYVRAVRSGDARALRGYGLMAVTAIATKDQTGGFFVLPSLHLAWLATERRAWRPLMAAGALSLVVLVLELGIPFNPEGFKLHVDMITGEASQPFRFPGTPAERQAAVVAVTVMGLGWSMGWVGLAAGLAGILVEVRRRRFLWLLLPAASYYVFFLVVAGYAYDRFLIGLGFVLAIFAGGFIEHVTRAGVAWRRERMAACAVGAAFVVWWGLSIDLMMLSESRYPAERWLRAHASPDARVAILGPRAYLPRIAFDCIVPGLASPPAMPPASLPPFVVANEETMRRGSVRGVDREWWTWLTSGAAPYRVAARFETKPAASLLTYTNTFSNGVEDEFTNLDKVGPRIVIYERIK